MRALCGNRMGRMGIMLKKSRTKSHEMLNYDSRSVVECVIVKEPMQCAHQFQAHWATIHSHLYTQNSITICSILFEWQSCAILDFFNINGQHIKYSSYISIVIFCQISSIWLSCLRKKKIGESCVPNTKHQNCCSISTQPSLF